MSPPSRSVVVAGTLLLLGAQSVVAVSLVNPVPLFTTSLLPMDAHDGEVRQWAAGGPFYYTAMSYDACVFISCGDPTCGHLRDHRVLIWASPTLAPDRGCDVLWSAAGCQPD